MHAKSTFFLLFLYCSFVSLAMRVKGNNSSDGFRDSDQNSTIGVGLGKGGRGGSALVIIIHCMRKGRKSKLSQRKNYGRGHTPPPLPWAK